MQTGAAGARKAGNGSNIFRPDDMAGLAAGARHRLGTCRGPIHSPRLIRFMHSVMIL